MRRQVPLPWERLLWSGRPAFPCVSNARFLLTDFRLVRLMRDRAEEVALHDIAEIQRTESGLDGVWGTSTIVVRTRSGESLGLSGVRRGAQLAAALELLSEDRAGRLDLSAVQAALAQDPRGATAGYRAILAGTAVVLIAVTAAAIGLHGNSVAVSYSPFDPIYPNGHKRDRADIVRFMEREVMPWARRTLGPIKGGPDRITCQTCHGRHAAASEWQMPSVAALPEPDVREFGWEQYGGTMDAQMRNAIYGYAADSEKQARAGYMRDIVMPGMAHLLHRPPYDFTKPYEYNRSRLAFGCYHCHKVK
jgi:hypothetical protein